MKSFVVILAIILIVAACSSSIPLGWSEPVSDKSNSDSASSQQARADTAMLQAQQQEASAHAAGIDETAQAVNSLNLPATQAALDAQNSAQALDAQAALDAHAALLVQKQSQTTATAQAMAVQQTEQSIQAQATVDARAMLLAQQQSQATATVQAMRQERVTAQRQSDWMAWFVPLALAIAFGVGLLLTARYISGRIDSANQKSRLVNQRMAVPEVVTLLPIPAVEPQTMTIVSPPIDGPLPADRAEAREEAERCKLAMRLLRDAINHLGAQSNRIPPAEQIGWQEQTWNMAVAILRPYGVEMLQGIDGATYLVGQYPNLQSLYIAMGERRLILYPPAPESLQGTLYPAH
jgi:hypothetical protein